MCRASPGPLLLSLALLALGGAAQAQTVSAQEAALLERIRLLEQRLEQLERQARPAARPAAARGASAAPGAGAAPAPSAPASPPPVRLSPQSPAPPPSPQAGAPLPAVQASAIGRQGAEAEEVPQEAFIFRDQAVTLRPGRFEASFDLGYARHRRTLSADRLLTGTATLRAGVMEGVEASLSLPFFHSTRAIETGPGLVSDRELTRLGDIALQVNIRGWGERELRPGAVFSLGVVAPTGPSPFLRPPQGLTEQAIPVDPLRLYNARGAWAVRLGAQFFKTFDPIMVFAGASYEHAFEAERQGVAFQPGRRINYNAGMSFAMSERSTLGLSFLGSYTTRLRAGGIAYRPTAMETGALRFALVQKMAESLWVEPSLVLGLVQESPSFQLGLGLRYRF